MDWAKSSWPDNQHSQQCWCNIVAVKQLVRMKTQGKLTHHRLTNVQCYNFLARIFFYTICDDPIWSFTGHYNNLSHYYTSQQWYQLISIMLQLKFCRMLTSPISLKFLIFSSWLVLHWGPHHQSVTRSTSILFVMTQSKSKPHMNL